MTFPLPGQPGVALNNYGPYAINWTNYGSPSTTNVEPTPTAPPSFNSTNGVTSTQKMLSGRGPNIPQQGLPAISNVASIQIAGVAQGSIAVNRWT